MALHPVTERFIQEFLAQGGELSPQTLSATEKLSPEHLSGINPAQLQTPMMRQFVKAKEECPDALLFFRMGDFFELFGIDAMLAADILNITLTTRDKTTENPVPMAGVPVVSHLSAVKKCLQRGFKVAICDQIEEASAGKTLVKREIVRIATPAIPVSSGDEQESSTAETGVYLAAVIEHQNIWTLAFVDVSTGEFRVTSDLDLLSFQQELLTVKPKEYLVAKEKIGDFHTLLLNIQKNLSPVTPIESWILKSPSESEKLFEEFFGKNYAASIGLHRWKHGSMAVCAILQYLKHTQKQILKNIHSLSCYEVSNYLTIDNATKRHLDFFTTVDGDKKGSLFWFLNECSTAAGERELYRRLNYPSRHVDEIELWLQHVDDFVFLPKLHTQCTEQLKNTFDIQRIIARTAQKQLDPKGAICLKQTLKIVPEINKTIEESSSKSIKNLQLPFDDLKKLNFLYLYLDSALMESDSPITSKQMPIFKTGFSAALDELYDLTENLDSRIEDLEKKERTATGIANLRIGFTRAFGYYFEISKGKLSQIPKHFIRKQTLTNGERFITEELKELEEKSLSAMEKRSFLEKHLFEQLCQELLKYKSELNNSADFLAKLDICCNFATLAQQQNWCRPQINTTNVSQIHNSVHPILKQLQAQNEPFISNDIEVGKSDAKILLITGPNMAGKSTIMRQLAIAQIFAQMGCYVPAESASIGIADKIFTRIGSGDNPLKSQSTFMVEMLESAHMLRQATSNSLLLIDELGRGTSTYDGISIAWAILEEIYSNIGARTLFSTHYQELQNIIQICPGIKPMQMEILERFDPQLQTLKIIFNRKFIFGTTKRSYGIHVAQLAGIPQHVIAKAQSIMERLTTTSQLSAGAKIAADSNLNRESKQRSKKRSTETPLFDFEALDSV